jgi:response regulator RpfG family c-di-GMP phosphodiesterase
MNKDSRYYLDRQEIGETEEQAKRWWKTLLLLLALALRVKQHIQPGAEAAPRKAEEAAPAVAGVLLADTDPESSKELTEVLGIGGFEVTATLAQEEILAGVEQASLVILDEAVPDSQKLCARIRERSQVPIILLGADPSEEAWNRAVQWGADAYLRRVMSRREFVARIRAILRRYLKAKDITMAGDETPEDDSHAQGQSN